MKAIKSNVAAWTKELLTCAYQRTKNSSAETLKSAKAVAKDANGKFLEFQIDDLVNQYITIAEAAIGRKLVWGKDDIALQNIQARVRAPSVWLLANLKGALLLSTSNRSEAAVGYTTMDGDTCGGLSPLGGIDKAYLRHWLKWLEKTGPSGLRSFPSLKFPNALAPTAELRPSKDKQTDERDLMPYIVLDRIERLAIRDKMSPREVLVELSSELKGKFTRKDLKLWIHKFFHLWSISQWKRERYATSFHLDDENLDPKTWCRFPILSGNYQDELEELKQS